MITRPSDSTRSSLQRPTPMRPSNLPTIFALAFLLSLVLSAGSARAQAFSLRWYTIDCGGGTSTSGDYELQGTIAQFDAQGTLTGGAAEITGGYWNPGLEISCPADFNNDGHVSVQDIFDFLSSWFSGCFAQGAPPCNGHNSDFNGSGTITVQDIFDFLAAWFAGCPGY